MTVEIDHRQLRLLCAVVENHSVSRAATRLGVTQPTASYLLGRLRDLLRDPLFLKTSDGMMPTPKTLALYREIRKGLDILDNAFDPGAFDPGTSDRTFRFAMIDIGELVFLPPILNRLRAAAPEVAIQSIPTPSERIPRALDLGDIDFAIGNMPEICASTAHRTVFREHYVAVMRRGHPKVRARLTRKLFGTLEFISIASPYTGQIAVENALAEHGVVRKAKLTVPNYTSVAAAIAQTDLAVVAPSRVARAFATGYGLRSRPLPIPVPPFLVRVHWSVRHEGNAGHLWMRELLTTTLARLWLGCLAPGVEKDGVHKPPGTGRGIMRRLLSHELKRRPTPARADWPAFSHRWTSYASDARGSGSL
jgi:DNA-binding transcriptional LysR family regulator